MKKSILFIYLFFIGFLNAQEPDLLKEADINKIMKQIFAKHLEENGITKNIIQSAFRVYICQFDPYKIYLLESEVAPFLQLSDAETEEIFSQYRTGNFIRFKELNNIIQKAIIRNREIRKKIEQNPSAIFIEKPQPPLDYPSFADKIDDLPERISAAMRNYISAEKYRFGPNIVKQKENEILENYELQLHHFENQYLFETENGQKLPKEEQENLFAMHVLKALANSLDHHTKFYSNSEAFDMKIRLKKKYEGFGIGLQETPNGIRIAAVIPNSPADKSGLIHPNDYLESIDGKSLKDTDFQEVLDKLRSQESSKISLGIRTTDNDKELKNVTLSREEVTVNADRVSSSFERFGNGIIGKIAFNTFYEGENGVSSENDVKKAIEQLKEKGNLRGLVLDLRHNSGGFLSQAVKVAGLFITNGVIVMSKTSEGKEHIFRDTNNEVAYNGPLVILTSYETASAAEIVAQALQDYGVAVVVGDPRTYGKGTIQAQTVTDNKSTSYFKVTVGEYYTVSGKTPDVRGVKADIVLPSGLEESFHEEEVAFVRKGKESVQPEFNDTLSDLKPEERAWYLKYYMPTLQHRRIFWQNMMPLLKKNSEYRISHNKNYQFFLTGKVIDSKEDEEDISLKQKNAGVEDLQMEEALNIVKDMIYLENTHKGTKIQSH